MTQVMPGIIQLNRPTPRHRRPGLVARTNAASPAYSDLPRHPFRKDLYRKAAVNLDYHAYHTNQLPGGTLVPA